MAPFRIFSLSNPNWNPAERIRFGSEEKARPAYEKALRPFHRLRAFSELVRLKGLEPTRITAREPKGDVTSVMVFIGPFIRNSTKNILQH